MGADEDRYEPMELGSVPHTGSAANGDAPPSTPQWQRWAVLGAALLAGAIIGIVGNNARNDAAEYARVELVRGTVDIEFGPPLSSGAQTLTVNLINTGPHEVEILDIDVHGFTSAADAPTEPVTAAPGEWVLLRTSVASDCENRPPGTLELQVRTSSGEKTVVITGQPGDDQLIWAWQSGCDNSTGTGVFIGDTRTLSADATGARIVLPVTNGDDEPLTITDLEATTPGFTIRTDPLPIVIPAGSVTEVVTTWTVTDCDDAGRFSEAVVAVNISTDSMETRVSQPLGTSTLIELVRLTVRVCET